MQRGPDLNALLARFIAAGIVSDRDLQIPTLAIDEALGRSSRLGSNATVLVAAVIAAQYILLAGEVLAKLATEPNPGWKWPTLEKWKAWAMKFKDAAATAAEESEWDLKRNAQKAYNKMVQLHPELFEEQAGGGSAT